MHRQNRSHTVKSQKMPGAFNVQISFQHPQHDQQRNAGKQRSAEYDHRRLQLQKFTKQAGHTKQQDRNVDGYQFTVLVLNGLSPQ